MDIRDTTAALRPAATVNSSMTYFTAVYARVNCTSTDGNNVFPAIFTFVP